MGFLQTLEQDAENLVESDFPSTQGVRAVLGALVKRVEQLAGLEDTVAPAPAAEPPPIVQPTMGGAAPPPSVAPTIVAPAADPAPDAPAPDTSADPAATAKAQQIADLKAQLAALEA